MGHSEDDAVHKIPHKMKVHQLKISVLVSFNPQKNYRCYKKIDVILVQCLFNTFLLDNLKAASRGKSLSIEFRLLIYKKLHFHLIVKQFTPEAGHFSFSILHRQLILNLFMIYVWVCQVVSVFILFS